MDDLAVLPFRDRHLLQMHRLVVRGDKICRGFVERDVVTSPLSGDIEAFPFFHLTHKLLFAFDIGG